MSETAAPCDSTGYENTDRHLWPETSPVDAPEEKLFVTSAGGIGINIGGHVIVRPLREWHRLAASQPGRSVAWVVQLKYSEDRWSGEMLTDVLPPDKSTYRVLRPLYAHPPAQPDREALARAWNEARQRLSVVHSVTGKGFVYQAGETWPVVAPEDQKLFEAGSWAEVDEWVDNFCADAILSLLSGAGTKSANLQDCENDAFRGGLSEEAYKALYDNPSVMPDYRGADTKSDGGPEIISSAQMNAIGKAAIAGQPLTTEELDRLQFGRVLHARPSAPSRGPDVREAARACADDLINICEAAQRVATRTGNTFVLDRERVAGMIAGKFSSLTRPLGGFAQEETPLTKQELPGAVSSRCETAIGWKLVPMEPTRAMTMRACDFMPSCEHVFGHGGAIAANIYRGMLEAAPLPAVAETDADAQRDDGLLSGVSSDPT